MKPADLHAALVDRTEREGIDLLEKVLEDTRLAGFHEGRDAAADLARAKRASDDHAFRELEIAIRGLEPPKAEDRSRQEKTTTKEAK